jgi:hypothetical protein
MGQTASAIEASDPHPEEFTYAKVESKRLRISIDRIDDTSQKINRFKALILVTIRSVVRKM